jgi:hypothetical protein
MPVRRIRSRDQYDRIDRYDQYDRYDRSIPGAQARP